MKLSEAQDYQRRILDLTKQLNLTIHEASEDGLIVEAECVEYTVIGYSPSVAIQTSVKVNPQDID